MSKTINYCNESDLCLRYTLDTRPTDVGAAINQKCRRTVATSDSYRLGLSVIMFTTIRYHIHMGEDVESLSIPPSNRNKHALGKLFDRSLSVDLTLWSAVVRSVLAGWR